MKDKDLMTEAAEAVALSKVKKIAVLTSPGILSERRKLGVRHQSHTL